MIPSFIIHYQSAKAIASIVNGYNTAALYS